MRAAAALSVIANCCPCVGHYDDGGERIEEADVLFHRDPRFLGGDGAYSIDLGHDRVLWLFGDSFIATSPALTRRESTLVRNSIAVSTGRDPRTAAMEHAWRDGTPPSAYFPDAGDHWFWPMHGFRTPDGPLVIFLAEQRPTPGQGLGFAAAGYRAVRIVDPDGPPSSWIVEPLVTAPAPHDPVATVGTCTATTTDNDLTRYLVAVAVDGDEHNGRLVRWPLLSVADGDLSSPAWWTGSAWVQQDQLVANPAIAIPDAGSECSLTLGYYDYNYVASRGFGATTIALRTASVGEFANGAGMPLDLYTPPESESDNAFVYAAKAHAMFGTDDETLVVTYVDNSFDFDDLFDPAREQTLYYPKFARIRHAYRCE